VAESGRSPTDAAMARPDVRKLCPCRSKPGCGYAIDARNLGGTNPEVARCTHSTKMYDGRHTSFATTVADARRTITMPAPLDSMCRRCAKRPKADLLTVIHARSRAAFNGRAAPGPS
jgi:hypothetical protein